MLSRMSDQSDAEGYSLQLAGGKLQVNLVKRWLDDALRVETDRAACPRPLAARGGDLRRLARRRRRDGLRRRPEAEIERAARRAESVVRHRRTAAHRRRRCGSKVSGPRRRRADLYDRLGFDRRRAAGHPRFDRRDRGRHSARALGPPGGQAAGLLPGRARAATHSGCPAENRRSAQADDGTGGKFSNHDGHAGNADAARHASSWRAGSTTSRAKKSRPVCRPA